MRRLALSLFAIISFSLGIFLPSPSPAEDQLPPTTSAYGFDPSPLSELSLPQPASVIVQNMQPSLGPITLPPAPSTQKSTLGKYLEPLRKAEVLGDSTEVFTTPRLTRVSKITIAVVGDSMVDTMGTNLPYLEQQLKKIYPNTSFILLNYGIGSTNIDSITNRTTQPYVNQDRAYEAISSLKPNLVILESFAYNPLPLADANLNYHSNKLADSISRLKTEGISNIMLLATITPNLEQFGKGPGGVNWPEDQVTTHLEAINAYLKNTFKVAEDTQTAIIDAYYPSQDLLGNGLLDYINSHDHIHPSQKGHQFIASRIANAIVASRMFE